MRPVRQQFACAQGRHGARVPPRRTQGGAAPPPRSARQRQVGRFLLFGFSPFAGRRGTPGPPQAVPPTHRTRGTSASRAAVAPGLRRSAVCRVRFGCEREEQDTRMALRKESLSAEVSRSSLDYGLDSPRGMNLLQLAGVAVSSRSGYSLPPSCAASRAPSPAPDDRLSSGASASALPPLPLPPGASSRVRDVVRAREVAAASAGEGLPRLSVRAAPALPRAQPPAPVAESAEDSGRVLGAAVSTPPLPRAQWAAPRPPRAAVEQCSPAVLAPPAPQAPPAAPAPPAVRGGGGGPGHALALLLFTAATAAGLLLRRRGAPVSQTRAQVPPGHRAKAREEARIRRARAALATHSCVCLAPPPFLFGDPDGGRLVHAELLRRGAPSSAVAAQTDAHALRSAPHARPRERERHAQVGTRAQRTSARAP